MRLVVYPCFRSDVHGVFVSVSHPLLTQLKDFLPPCFLNHVETDCFNVLTLFIPDSEIQNETTFENYYTVYQAFSFAEVDLVRSLRDSQQTQTKKQER